MCVSQRKGSGANANDIVLMNSCTEKWTFTASGSLKHGPTGRCVMPNKGSATNNNKIVLSSTCDTDNQKFRWQPSKLHKVFSFVFLILLSLLVNRCYNMANKLVQVLGVGFLFKQNIRSFSMSWLAIVVCITAKMNHVFFISFSWDQIYDLWYIHLNVITYYMYR